MNDIHTDVSDKAIFKSFFQAPFWVTPFIIPVIGRTKVGDPSLIHITMLT